MGSTSKSFEKLFGCASRTRGSATSWRCSLRNIGEQSSKQPRRDRKPLDQYWRSAEELAEDQNRRVFLGYASPKYIRCPMAALICRE